MKTLLSQLFGSGSEVRREAWFTAAALAVYALYLYPLIAHPAMFSSNPDFYQHLTFFEQFLRGVRDFGQFPWRADLLGGGVPVLGHPNDPSLDPLVVFAIAFGPVVGLKLFVIVTLVVSVWAMVRLCREVFAIPIVGALFAALLMGGAGWIPSQLLDGNYKFVTAFWTPVALLFLHRARTRRSYLFAAALALYPMLSHGGPMFLTGMLFVGVFEVARSLSSFREIGRTVGRLAVVCGILVALGLPKIYASVELESMTEGHVHLPGEQTYSRVVENIRAYETSYAPGRFLRYFVTDSELSRAKMNHYCYVGWVPFLLGLVGMAAVRRVRAVAGISFVFFVWLAMGPTLPVDLFRVVWTLVPPLHYLWKLPKYLAPFIVIALAIGAGGVSIPLAGPRPRAALRLALVVAFAGSLAGLAVVERPRLAEVYTEPPFAGETIDAYCQVAHAGLSTHRSQDVESMGVEKVYFERQQFYQMLSGVGTTNWAVNTIVDAPITPRYFAPIWKDEVYDVVPLARLRPNHDYRGEAWLEGSDARAVLVAMSPNRIVVDVEPDRPGVLAINQVYLPQFTSPAGTVVDVDGLLGVRLDRVGPQRVVLEIRHRDLLALMALAALVLVAGIAWMVLAARRPVRF